jgi:hypothetical protein
MVQDPLAAPEFAKSLVAMGNEFDPEWAAVARLQIPHIVPHTAPAVKVSLASAISQRYTCPAPPSSLNFGLAGALFADTSYFLLRFRRGTTPALARGHLLLG